MNPEALLAAARAASERAYAPYSGFPVGAAVLGANGRTYVGTNVENASFPLALCAERAAVAVAVAAGCRELVAAAVWVPRGAPAPPCGACRQVLQEFAVDPGGFAIVYASPAGRRHATLAELLPSPFELGEGS